MNKNNTIKSGIIILSALAVCVLGISVFINRNNSVKKPNDTEFNNKNTEIYNFQPQYDFNNNFNENISLYYLLRYEENILYLYEINNEVKTIIKSSPIDIEFLPSEDISALKKGIKILTCEEGYQLIEDFTS